MIKIIYVLFAVILALAISQICAGESKTVEIKVRDIDPAAAAKISYAREIKPLLEKHCNDCHNADERKGQFETTSVDNLFKKGKRMTNPGVIPGIADNSAIVQRMRGVGGEQMPKGEKPLTEDELHLVRSWIQAGAKDDSATVKTEAVSSPKKLAEPAVPLSETARTAFDFAKFVALPEKEKLLEELRAERLKSMPPAALPPKQNALNPIDQFIPAKWPAGVTPVACDDATFLRRVYLDIIGLIPSAVEARRFLDDHASDKRAKLIDELLARNADYAAHWTPFWEDALGSNDSVGGIKGRGNTGKWVRYCFEVNKPFDLMVAELLDPALHNAAKPAKVAKVVKDPKDTKDAKDGKDIKDVRPPTPATDVATVAKKIPAVDPPGSYIMAGSHSETTLSAANTAQVFLGTSMKCASCHNHFLNKEWPQARFLAFAGMFSNTDLEVIRCEKASGKIVPAQFPFDIPGVVETGAVNRQHVLALWLTDPANPRFSRSIVNRLWKRYLGLGLVEPVDDFRADLPPSHPELLDWLADDLARHGFDLKHTIRQILTSATYQLKYDAKLEDKFDVAKPGEPRLFRSPALRRLTAEQFIDSVRLGMAQMLDEKKRTNNDRNSTALTRALGKAAARAEISTGRPDDVAVVQSLELMNGKDLQEMIYKGKLLAEAASEKDAAKGVEKLYWSALSRPPSKDELDLGVSFIASSQTGAKPAEKIAAPADEIWLDDDTPKGASLAGNAGADSWKWVDSAEHPAFSGKRSHTHGTGVEDARKNMQHYFTGAQFKAGPNDTLYVYVWLDPKNPPSEIMLQFNIADAWEHRAYWGKDIIQFGANNTISRHPAGVLPKLGEWVRLEVSASEIGIDKNDQSVNGLSFDQSGGKMFWDRSGVVHGQKISGIEVYGDILWALFCSPEFQYIK